MKSLNMARLITATSLLACSSSMAMPATIECNDCTGPQIQQAASQHVSNNDTLLVVDFVNATVAKFAVSDEGQLQAERATLGDVNYVNRQFDYRKTTLRAAK